jgi:class 3 adenylate cyclase
MRTSLVNREYRFSSRSVAEQTLKEGAMQSEAAETHAMFNVLRQSANADVTDAIESLVRHAPDHKLCRINALDFASKRSLNEEQVIAAFLHAARIGLFELSWNVLCPGCGSVLDPNATLKTVLREKYECEQCAAGYQVTLDESVEVTFTVTARVRRIAAHSPETLSIWEYYRQILWSSGVDLPEGEAFELAMEEAILDSVELPPGEKAILSLSLPAAHVVVFEPVTHAAQFLDVKGEPTRERQSVSVVINNVHAPTGSAQLRPGPVRLLFENRTNMRVLPAAWITGSAMHRLMSRRKAFLTAKRLLSNQTFREVYGTETLDVDQRLNITSLTFLFTDLKDSVALYERIGDLAAHDLVRSHFHALTRIVASEGGATVRTIGDAVMATFPTPDRAVAAALRMREAMDKLNQGHKTDDLLLKIGIHEGPCLAVMENGRQDYFGRTVNVAARVQNLAVSWEILATGSVIENPQTSMLLESNNLKPVMKRAALKGIADAMMVYEIP